MTAPTTAGDVTLSAECMLGQQPEYADVHDLCRQTTDVPLPHGGGILLVRRCGCACHWPGGVS
jgi:hypothetical protein